LSEQKGKPSLSIALISIHCEDRPGLVAGVTGRLYDLEINLGDTAFAVLGGGAELTLLAKLPDRLTLAELESELRSLPELKDAKLTVTPFGYRGSHDERARITHRIEITGDDSPGLIARLSEAFPGFGANIVWLNSESLEGASGARFLLRMAIWVPAEKADACLATVANTAGQMNLKCQWSKET
jgi:glycine cleavage system transcriptional repressor